MLETICSITRKYPSTIVIGIISLVIQTAFSIWFSLTVIGAYQTWFATTSNNARLNLAMVFLVFSFYWTSQVISYTTHVILAGLFATVYYLNDTVRFPIWGSAKRALTTSFGSICFGSLLIAFVNLLRYFIQIARGSTDNPVFGFFLCIVDCIVGCFQGLFVSGMGRVHCKRHGIGMITSFLRNGSRTMHLAVWLFTAILSSHRLDGHGR